jgi:hypothetical protein
VQWPRGFQTIEEPGNWSKTTPGNIRAFAGIFFYSELKHHE